MPSAVAVSLARLRATASMRDLVFLDPSPIARRALTLTGLRPDGRGFGQSPACRRPDLTGDR